MQIRPKKIYVYKSTQREEFLVRSMLQRYLNIFVPVTNEMLNLSQREKKLSYVADLFALELEIMQLVSHRISTQGPLGRQI